MRIRLSSDDTDAAGVAVCAIAGTAKETATKQAERTRTRVLCAPIGKPYLLLERTPGVSKSHCKGSRQAQQISSGTGASNVTISRLCGCGNVTRQACSAVRRISGSAEPYVRSPAIGDPIEAK